MSLLKENKNKKTEVTPPPSGLRVVIREFKKDKLALISLIIIVAILLTAFIGSLVVQQSTVMQVSLGDRYAIPGSISRKTGVLLFLGGDDGGRDVFGQLLIGTRNSVIIGFVITIITSIIGVSIGIISGYYGGMIDNIIMRIIDFIMILPTTMLVIIFVTVVPKYNAFTFIAIMSGFYWTGKARLFRAKSLSESQKEYVAASKTLGTSDVMIMFKGILPNLSSLILTNLTINFAGNIGIETALTYLGFGLPSDTPSLGTLINYASNPDILESYLYIWLPAAIVILVLMLSINYVGQAIKRAADARQRLG